MVRSQFSEKESVFEKELAAVKQQLQEALEREQACQKELAAAKQRSEQLQQQLSQKSDLGYLMSTAPAAAASPAVPRATTIAPKPKVCFSI
jgi:hypothetical protein